MALIHRVKSVYREEGIVALSNKSVLFLYRRAHNWVLGDGSYPSEYEDLEKLSDEELLSIIRHESHRIEKAVYNKTLSDKDEYYQEKFDRTQKSVEILKGRGYSTDHPIIDWSESVCTLIETEGEDFVNRNSEPSPKTNLDGINEFIDFVERRRSTRVWADDQPSRQTLNRVGKQLVESAKWAPNSGNRQAWRFKIIIDEQEKKLLDRIKEEHTVSAPLLIFVGMDKRVYGDVADSETSIYLDAGAAIMQMILTAQNAGLGTCWNHFGRDLIKSRKSNQQDYQKFCENLNIPEYIEPMAIVCVGKPDFLPPTPTRADTDDLIIS